MRLISQGYGGTTADLLTQGYTPGTGGGLGSYDVEVAADMPSVWLKFDEAIGAPAPLDSSGNGNDANYTGTLHLHQAGLPSGGFCAAVSSSDGYGQIYYTSTAPLPDADTPSGGTYELWWKTAAHPPAEGQLMLSNLYGMVIETDGHAHLQSYGHDMDTGVDVCDGAWHYLALEIAPTTGVWDGYVDGVQVVYGGHSPENANHIGYTLFGFSNHNDGTGFSERASGSIDNFAAYTHRIGAARILDHYNAGIASITHAANAALGFAPSGSAVLAPRARAFGMLGLHPSARFQQDIPVLPGPTVGESVQIRAAPNGPQRLTAGVHRPHSIRASLHDSQL